MNFENIFMLPNVIGDRSRRRFGSIFIKIPKVTFARSSLMYIKVATKVVNLGILQSTPLYIPRPTLDNKKII